MKYVMLSRAKTRVLMVDAAKFNEVQQFCACGLDNVDILITDSLPDEDCREFLQEHRIRLIVADGASQS